MIGKTLAHYKIVEKIGAGGMGEVYRATDSKLGRDIALKVLPQAFAQDRERMARFRREAQLLASLSHPNIGAIFGLEEFDGSFALVLELVEGPTLEDRLREGSLPLHEALPIARQIAEALEAAHEKGIVHRDLKPGNIKLGADHRVKVLDFGLAKAIQGDSDAASGSYLTDSPTISPAESVPLTGAHVILGTAAYMSPEQARGRGVDSRADIWAFGVLLFEMLTGQRPFRGETVSDTLAAVLRQEVSLDVLPAGIPSELRRLLRRCLTRDPRHRLQSIGDARVIIEEILAGTNGDAETVAGPSPPSKRTPLLVGTVVVLGLVSTLLAWRSLHRTAPPPVPRHLSIVLPENLTLAGASESKLAISPDGSQLVICASDGEQDRLYLRRLDQPGVVPLPDTEGAREPFFSPDGEWIAFTNDFQLWKLSLDTKQKVLVTEMSWVGGSWGTGGEIVIATDYLSGLVRVPAAGGPAQALTQPDLGERELNHSFPDILPDASVALFTSFRHPMNESRVEAVSLSTAERWVVVENAVFPRYLRSGHLAFVRDEALMVAPFDPRTAQTTGPATPAFGRTYVSPTWGCASFTASNDGTIAYVPRSVHPARCEVVRVDRTGREEVLLPATKTYAGPALSPDGGRLALTVDDSGLDLSLYDLSRRTQTRLAFTPLNEFGAVWHPDGDRVFFCVDSPPFDIYQLAVDGTSQSIAFLRSSLDKYVWDVSPDGNTVLFTDSPPGDLDDLGLAPLDGEEEPRFIRKQFHQRFAAFSPDGRFVVYDSNESGHREVFIEDVSGHGGRHLVTPHGGDSPRWAPNGEVLYWKRDTLFAMPVRTTPTLALGEPEELFTFDRNAMLWNIRAWDVAADGQHFYIVRTPDLLQPREVRVVVNAFEELAQAAP